MIAKEIAYVILRALLLFIAIEILARKMKMKSREKRQIEFTTLLTYLPLELVK